MLTRIVSRNMILLERTYMPILLYPAVGCSAYFGPESLPALAASFLTIASFDTMLVSFRRTARFGSLFNATILAGAALCFSVAFAVSPTLRSQTVRWVVETFDTHTLLRPGSRTDRSGGSSLPSGLTVGRLPG